jgi:transcriptional regulator with XRE-family HTH domain
LRKRRVARGLSQEALAKILGVSFQQLHKYETGENRMSVSRLYQLCLVLDAPFDWFFEGLPGKAAKARSAPAFEALTAPGEASSPARAQESLLLLRAYHSIDNPRLRQQLLSLAKTLGDEGSGDHQVRALT